MADPISSRVDDASRSRNYSSDDELTCHDDSPASGASASPARTASSTSGSIDGTLTAQADSGVAGPHAEAHADSDLHAGAFALRGKDARSGIDVEVFSASVHAGAREAAAQVGMARTGTSMIGGGHIAISGEVFTAQAHATYDNPDGSTGLGMSAGYTAVGGEVTANWSGNSATIGASVGTTFGISGGVRDLDHDGQPEYCGRVDFGLGSAGLCIEKVW